MEGDVLVKEGDIVKAILDAYEGHPRYTLWRNNTGVGRIHGSHVRFGKVGSADITGIMDGGRRVEIECKKVGGKTSKERIENQQKFADMIRKHGGLYVVAFSLDDVKLILG